MTDYKKNTPTDIQATQIARLMAACIRGIVETFGEDLGYEIEAALILGVKLDPQDDTHTAFFGSDMSTDNALSAVEATLKVLNAPGLQNRCKKC